MSGRMRALQLLVCVVAFSVIKVVSTSIESQTNHEDVQNVELFDGVSVKIPKGNNSTGKVMSIEIDTDRGIAEGISFPLLYIFN